MGPLHTARRVAGSQGPGVRDMGGAVTERFDASLTPPSPSQVAAAGLSFPICRTSKFALRAFLAAA